MKFKTITAAVLSAAALAGAALTGTIASAAEVTTSYDLASHTTAVSATSQDIVISDEFKVHLNGNETTAKADSIENGEIKFYRSADTGNTAPTGYIVFTPACSGTLKLNLKAGYNQKNNGARLYALEATENDLSNCTKAYNASNERICAQGQVKSTAGASDYLSEATTIDTHQTDNTVIAPYTFEGGKTYILYPFTYNSATTLSFKDFTYTYTVNEAQAYSFDIDDTLQNRDIAGFTADITGYDAVNSATWYLKKADTEYKEFTTATLPTVAANGGTVKIGLIVTGLSAQNVTASELSAGYTVSGTAATE